MEWAVNFCQALRCVCVWQLRLWHAGWGVSVEGGAGAGWGGWALGRD